MNIQRCIHAEIQDVMSFIDNHWQKGHVLATSRQLMDWQHGSTDGSYDYLVAKDDGKIWGVLGYISTRRFDEKLVDHNVIWLALWKVADGAPSGLGLRMLDALQKVEPHVAIAVNGINFKLPPLYKALKYEVGELQHYFVTNPRCKMSLASAPPGYSWPTPSVTGSRWQEMTASELKCMGPATIQSEALVKKTPSYFAARFYEHPIYRYRVFRIDGPDKECALIALRLVQHNGARVLRLVDFAGNTDIFQWMGSGLRLLLEETSAEYADFWAYGIDECTITPSGMVKVDPLGPLVVPNYFEPFLAENGRILCAIKRIQGNSQHAWIFRADGDQDRPNMLL